MATTIKKKEVSKKKTKRQVKKGMAFVQATYNNTIVTLADSHGGVLSWSSAGVVGFKGAKKATPYAASMIVKDAIDKAQYTGIKEVDVVVRGIGAGREAAVRAIHANGLTILSIKDLTPISHNGCRPKKPRRI